jgi:hypothetical protein
MMIKRLHTQTGEPAFYLRGEYLYTGSDCDAALSKKKIGSLK